MEMSGIPAQKGSYANVKTDGEASIVMVGLMGQNVLELRSLGSLQE
jgi:hypothetical protein